MGQQGGQQQGQQRPGQQQDPSRQGNPPGHQQQR
jgi:hypothetical protein